MPSDSITSQIMPGAISRYPFSFLYDGRHSETLLDRWGQEHFTTDLDAHRTRDTFIWTDPDTGFRAQCDLIRFSDFPAYEWIVYFEQTGTVRTPIIKNVQALDLTCRATLNDRMPYRLHRTNGAPSNPTDFEAQTVVVDLGHPVSMGGGGGRSSNRDFPFFTLETGQAAHRS